MRVCWFRSGKSVLERRCDKIRERIIDTKVWEWKGSGSNSREEKHLFKQENNKKLGQMQTSS